MAMRLSWDGVLKRVEGALSQLQDVVNVAQGLEFLEGQCP